jgi:hypothetical protein
MEPTNKNIKNRDLIASDFKKHAIYVIPMKVLQEWELNTDILRNENQKRKTEKISTCAQKVIEYNLSRPKH